MVTVFAVEFWTKLFYLFEKFKFETHISDYFNQIHILNSISPKLWCKDVKQRVFVMHGANDNMVPYTQSVQLSKNIPNAFFESIFENIPIAIFDRPKHSNSVISSKAAQMYFKYRVKDSSIENLVNMLPPAWYFFRSKSDTISASAIRKTSNWPSIQKKD